MTAQNFRPNIIFAELDHAGSHGTRGMKERAKVQIMGEHHISMLPGPSHDLSIRCICRTNITPVQCFMPTAGEQRNPVRRQVHIQQDLQAVWRRTSCSSERHAA